MTPQASKPYLVIARVQKVLIIVHIHRASVRAVNDVGYSLSLHHQPMMIAFIVNDEDALSIFVVGGDEAA